MQYKILSSTIGSFTSALTFLEKDVNKEIEDGWKPQGGVSITRYGDAYGCEYISAAQAMVKED